MSGLYSFAPLTSVDEGDIDIIFDESRAKRARMDRKLKFFAVLLVSSMLLLLIFVAVALSVGIPVGLYLTRYEPIPPPYYNKYDVLDTVEAQIALNPKPDWTYREDMIAKWIDAMNKYSKYMQFSRETALVDMYVQGHLSTNKCGAIHSLSCRVRKEVQTDVTTIDIKIDRGSKEASCSQPFWPSEQYYNASRQKCEEDLHPCFHKFTRGTSVTIDEHRDFETCGDVADIFPEAYHYLKDSDRGKSISISGRSLWWRLRWKGVAGNHMHYEITFTILYLAPLSCVESGVCDIYEGEWSLRFYSEGDQTWEKDVVEDFQNTFYNLVIEFDEYDDHKTCAHEYFEGKSPDHVGVNMEDHPERK